MAAFLYEVLIRGKSDGTLSGAHQIMGNLNVDGSVSYGVPTELDPATVSKLLGDTFPDLSNQIIALRNEIAALKDSTNP